MCINDVRRVEGAEPCTKLMLCIERLSHSVSESFQRFMLRVFLAVSFLLLVLGSTTNGWHPSDLRHSRTILKIREYLQLEGNGTAADLQWQKKAVETASAKESTTAGLQYLVEVAGREQRTAGQAPSVMITIANYEGVSTLLPIFIETLKKVSPSFANATVVITVSQQAFEACKDHQLLCFYDREADERNQELAHETANTDLPRNKTPLFLQIGWDKLKRLQDALQNGYNILFADTDIVWLRDPLPLLEDSEMDIQLTHDGWGPNIGVMYVRPSECTAVFMHDWLARRNTPESRDQYEFLPAVESAKQKCPAFKVEHMEKSEFPNGCCCGDKYPSNPEDARKWVLWHAACGGDLHSKKQKLVKILESSQNAE